MFRRKKKAGAGSTKDPAEARFESMMNLVKDLDRNDYNRLKKAMDSGYNAYNIIRNIETYDDIIDRAENELETEAK